jgi:hypothetical protein
MCLALIKSIPTMQIAALQSDLTHEMGGADEVGLDSFEV